MVEVSFLQNMRADECKSMFGVSVPVEVVVERAEAPVLESEPR